MHLFFAELISQSQDQQKNYWTNAIECEEEQTTALVKKSDFILKKISEQKTHFQKTLKSIKVLGTSREMEYIECASFIEIYWSLVSLAHFMTFTMFYFLKARNILALCRCQWIWCLL